MRALRELGADSFWNGSTQEHVRARPVLKNGDVVLDRSRNPDLTLKIKFWLETHYSAIPDLEEWARDRGCTWYSGDHCIVLVPRTEYGLNYLLEE